jgi:hypothetical protein
VQSAEGPLTQVTVQDLVYASSAARLQAGGPHPASVVLFTDQGSLWHVLVGALAGAMPSPWNLGAAALFTGYEVSKLGSGETAERTGGKFVEFGLGLILAGLFRLAGGSL